MVQGISCVKADGYYLAQKYMCVPAETKVVKLTPGRGEAIQEREYVVISFFIRKKNAYSLPYLPEETCSLSLL